MLLCLNAAHNGQSATLLIEQLSTGIGSRSREGTEWEEDKSRNRAEVEK